MAISKTFDLSKLRKSVTKSIEGLSFGFTQPTVWFSSGCYALNWLLTKDFYKAFPLDGKINMLVGDSGSGKSYIASGNVVRDALKQGVTVVLIDTEDRLDEQWMRNIGVDPESELLQRIQTNSIEKTMQIVSMVAKDYKEQFKDVSFEEQPGLLFVIDSLGAIYPEDEMSRFSEGELSITDGLRAAAAKTKLVNSILSNIASTKMGCLVTNHVYSTTDMYSDDVIPGGKKLVFLTTQILQMNKLKLKAKDVEADMEYKGKDSDVVGIRSKCKVYKSNWNKCFESVEVQIPYTTGMWKYSGLFELFEQQGVLERVGNKYIYKSLATGEVMYNEFRKNYTEEMLDVMMKDFQENYGKKDLVKAVAEVVSEESSEDEE